MGIFRYENKYAAPTKAQRDRYMRGEYEEHRFGPDDRIVLIVYDEGAYLKDDIDGIRVLFTGSKDKEKVYDEVRRLLDYHGQKENCPGEFRTGNDS